MISFVEVDLCKQLKSKSDNFLLFTDHLLKWTGCQICFAQFKDGFDLFSRRITLVEALFEDFNDTSNNLHADPLCLWYEDLLYFQIELQQCAKELNVLIDFLYSEIERHFELHRQ